ncbi:VOC family protein [Paenibacillus sp. TSA_86.1]|uniref:VOC family protein n=1 Tax=Paenibacillus sp. TSA_86.1 TaxID=3415649 RepID=UPI004045971D
MILGLYEAHLPVSNLKQSIKFYSKLGLELAWREEDTAFFWIEKEKSWVGLWQGEEHKTSYHPSLRHIAFRVSYEDLRESVKWLQTIEIEPVPFGTRDSIDPFVRLKLLYETSDFMIVQDLRKWASKHEVKNQRSKLFGSI